MRLSPIDEFVEEALKLTCDFYLNGRPGHGGVALATRGGSLVAAGKGPTLAAACESALKEMRAPSDGASPSALSIAESICAELVVEGFEAAPADPISVPRGGAVVRAASDSPKLLAFAEARGYELCPMQSERPYTIVEPPREREAAAS